MTVRRFALSAIAAAILSTGAAQAATTPLTATQMLQQFNAVITKNVDSTSHVDGRTFVGGTLNGSQNAVFAMNSNKLPASGYAGLTVLGAGATGAAVNNVQVNALGAVVIGNITNSTVNSGYAYIQGNSTNTSYNGSSRYITGSTSGGNLNAQSKTPTGAVQTAYDVAASTNFYTVQHNLSAQLSKLKSTETTIPSASTGGVVFSNNDSVVTFNAQAVNGVAVFDLTSYDTAIFSSKVTDLNLNLNGATTVIFNTNDSTIASNANFNFGNENGSKIIWNFAGATSVTTNRTIVGQVLVSDGTFSNLGGANVEGGVYAQNLVQRGEIHVQAFTGTIPAAPVPEPETYAMLLGGLGLMGLVARRRQRS
jgi:choice-of-anchor A domain-containing protein